VGVPEIAVRIEEGDEGIVATVMPVITLAVAGLAILLR
jgi:hypothetical protein